MYRAKLTGTSSAIENASYSDLVTWANLVAPSAAEELDWEQVQALTGKKTVGVKYGTHTLRIGLMEEYQNEAEEEAEAEETPTEEVSDPPTTTRTAK